MVELTRKKIISLILVVAILIFVSLMWNAFISDRQTEIQKLNDYHGAVLDENVDVPLVSLVATDLRIPWSLDFMPDGSIIFTEREGNLRLVDNNGGLLDEPLLVVNDAEHTGEGGLLGVTLHPEFDTNGYIYLYYTYRDSENDLTNRVVRYQMRDLNFHNMTIIVDGIPGANIHNGGRIKFGPEGHLYITTGDAGIADLAQDVDSLAGKILRIKEDGSVPEDNPFPGSPVFSLGHRNPQGLVWDSDKRLWSTEHGATGNDELNLIEAGKNYGWPLIEGPETAPGLESPVIHSGRNTWAPSGADYFEGSVYFGGLRGQSLYEAKVYETPPDLIIHFDGEFGRLRGVFSGPDGNLYIFTSNRDGRGVPLSRDDQIIRVNPQKVHAQS